MSNLITKSIIDKSNEMLGLVCSLFELKQGAVRPFRLILQDRCCIEIGYLIFSYYSNGKIFITDFKVNNKGIGHGRLLHDFLIEVLPQIQKIVIDLKVRHEKISLIEGEMHPDGISLEDLVGIYKHFGYTTKGNWISMDIRIDH